MPTIEINGKKLEASPGQMIIQVADEAGIYIPRFCYHKKLPIAANCRMCLVDVEKSAKPLPACATPIAEGMQIYTRSAKAVEAQRAVMSYLLINHPLDCPICDQGGECELQDLSLGYGYDSSFFSEPKRAVPDEDFGPLIASEMTRCIHCTRCVRFGQEVAGTPELGATQRGEHMEIGTYIKKGLSSELSGNIIDLCPVGALTSKPFRFKARAWELNQKASIAPHDCVGSQIYVHSLRDRVLRVVPRAAEPINEIWISDRDRFSYSGLYSHDRLTTPLIKRNGQFEQVDWGTALAFIKEQMSKIPAADKIAGLISPTSTLEECYLFNRILRALGTNNIDHRLQQTDFADQEHTSLFPGLTISIEALEHLDHVLLIGSNIKREQPLLSARLRKAAQRGARITMLNPIDCEVNFPLSGRVIAHPSELPVILMGVAKILVDKALQSPYKALFQNIVPVPAAHQLAEMLLMQTADSKSALLLGALALNHPDASMLRALAQIISSLTVSALGYLTAGPNSAGAWIAGAVPHRKAAGELINKPGLSIDQMWATKLSAYWLFNIEPELDCAHSGIAMDALQQADFVVAFSPYAANSLLKCADVILPIAPFTETAGTFINAEGRWQSFEAVVPPFQDARPGWQVLRVLAKDLGLEGFDKLTAQSIKDEVQNLVKIQEQKNVNQEDALPQQETLSKKINQLINPVLEPLQEHISKLMSINEWVLYASDSLTRRSQPLQAAPANEPVAVRINTKTASQHQLQTARLVQIRQAQCAVQLPLVLDESIADGCIWIPQGRVETSALRRSFDWVEVVSA